MSAPRTRGKYDTFVVYLFCTNKEHLLPVALRESIPASTIATWKNLIPESYIGYAFRPNINAAIEYLEITHERDALKKTMAVLMRTWVRVTNIVTPVLTKHKKHTDILINEVQRLLTVIPKRTALKIAGLSAAAFQYRLNKQKYFCPDSAFALCLRRHPLQLSITEINTMKSLLNDVRFVCWPVSCIAYMAQRKKLLTASLSTWYKYLRKIGWKKNVKQEKEKHTGLVTTAPNQFLHVDTTFWNIEHNVKAAIVFVSDNFSKAILGWSVSLKKNAENVSRAIDAAIQTIHQYHPDHLCTLLMADGGTENHSKTVNELLQNTVKPAITKIIAQKDISFSNAPIEAINKIIKVYLRFYKPATLQQLIECIQMAVHDYSFMRPHGSLHGATPMEIYTGKSLTINTSSDVTEAKRKRLEQNRKHSCGTCN